MSLLSYAFNKAQTALPDITRGTSPVGSGGFGLVVAHADDTLTKIIYHPGSEKENADAYLANEVEALRILREHPIDGVETPVLLGEPERLDHPDYIAAFQMTRVSGANGTWLPPSFTLTRKYDFMHESAGRLLACFHREAAALPFIRREHPAFTSDEIQEIPELGDTTNAALREANAYLQAHTQAGVIHDDFHLGNVMFNTRDEATGLIDFAMSRRTGNIFTDFFITNTSCLDALIRGYEQESGVVVDRHLITASSLAKWTHIIGQMDNDESKTFVNDKIREKLNALRDVTGLKV